MKTLKLPNMRPLPALLPTTAGSFWALSALILLGVAINYANNLCFALAFLMLSLWISAARDCFSSLSRLQWDSSPIVSVHAGEVFRLSVHARLHERDSSRRSRAIVRLCAGKGKNRIEGAALAFPECGKRGENRGENREHSLRLELALPAITRGWQKVSHLRLIALHPLGLWRISRALPEAAALIWPSPAGNQPLPTDAPNPAHKRFESDDFQELNAYTPGDSPRRINWRVYARRGELAVNRFDGGAGGQALWLDIADCAGDAEKRLSQLCLWVRQAERQGREYGLRLGNGKTIAPAEGRHHQQECLTQLALYGEEK